MTQAQKLSLAETTWMKEQALYRQLAARKEAVMQPGSQERDLQALDAAKAQLCMWEAVCEVPSRLDASRHA